MRIFHKLLLPMLLLAKPSLQNLNCTIDQCKICQNSTTIKCTQCEDGYYLKTFYSTEKQNYYNDCWSKIKLFILIGSLLLSSLLLCCLVYYAYRKGLNAKIKNKVPQVQNLVDNPQKKIREEQMVRNANYDPGENLATTERFLVNNNNDNNKKFIVKTVINSPANERKNSNIENNIQNTQNQNSFILNNKTKNNAVSPHKRVITRIIRHLPVLKNPQKEPSQNPMGIKIYKNPQNKFQNNNKENSFFESFNLENQKPNLGIKINKPLYISKENGEEEMNRYYRSPIKLPKELEKKQSRSEIKQVLSPSMRGSGQVKNLMHTSMVLNRNRDHNQLQNQRSFLENKINKKESFLNFGTNLKHPEQKETKKILEHVVEFNIPNKSSNNNEKVKYFNTTGNKANRNFGGMNSNNNDG